MQVEGKVTEIGKTQKGAPKVLVDGKVYYPGNTEIRSLQVGDVIRFESTSFGKDGTAWGMNEWTLIAAASKYPPGVISGPHANGASSASTGPGGPVTNEERPCISNSMAALIEKGIITDPAEYGRWVQAIKNALRS
jgi:hypothetical protein